MLIQEADIELHGSRVVVRHGKPFEADHLAQVAADSARTIVLVADQTKTKEENKMRKYEKAIFTIVIGLLTLPYMYPICSSALDL